MSRSVSHQAASSAACLPPAQYGSCTCRARTYCACPPPAFAPLPPLRHPCEGGDPPRPAASAPMETWTDPGPRWLRHRSHPRSRDDVGVRFASPIGERPARPVSIGFILALYSAPGEGAGQLRPIVGHTHNLIHPLTPGSPPASQMPGPGQALTLSPCKRSAWGEGTCALRPPPFNHPKNISAKTYPRALCLRFRHAFRAPAGSAGDGGCGLPTKFSKKLSPPPWRTPILSSSASRSARAGTPHERKRRQRNCTPATYAACLKQPPSA